MQDERLRECEIEVADEIVAIDGNIKLHSLLGLAWLEQPHGSLDLDSVGLDSVCTIVGAKEWAVNQDGVDNDSSFLSAETRLSLSKSPNVLDVLLANLSTDEDFSLNVTRRLTGVLLVLRLLVVVERHSVFGEVIVVDRCLYVQRIPIDRFAIVTVRELVLGERVGKDVVHVEESGRLDTVVIGAAFERLRVSMILDLCLA